MANIGNFLRVANYDDNPPKNLRAWTMNSFAVYIFKSVKVKNMISANACFKHKLHEKLNLKCDDEINNQGKISSHTLKSESWISFWN
jgi:hypothetical protein